MFKRFLVVFTVSLLLFAVSCAGGTNPESFNGDFSYTDGKIDLSGTDFLIQVYEYDSLVVDSLLTYQKDTSFYDAALVRIKNIEKEYNCVINTENMSSGGLDGNFTPQIMAGLYVCDALLTGFYDLRPYTESKIFEPLNEVFEIIDYTDSKKWGSPKLLEWVVWDENIYGVVPVQWPDYYLTSFGHMFVFNESFASSRGQPDPREYVESDKWSREMLGNMMETYTYSDGEREVKALCQYPGHFIDQALRSNNAQVYTFADGEYKSGYHTENGKNALTWASEFLNITYKDCIIPHTNDKGNYENLINGNCAMVLTYAAYIYGSRSTISYELENYCVLPMPNGPARSGDEYIGTFESVRNTLMFPLNGKNFSAAAIICNGLFDALDEYDGEKIKEYYLKNYFFDERDYDVLFEVAGNTHFSYYADGFRTRITEVLVSNAVDVSTLLDSTEDYYNNLVAERVVPTVTSMAGLFGDNWENIK